MSRRILFFRHSLSELGELVQSCKDAVTEAKAREAAASGGGGGGADKKDQDASSEPASATASGAEGETTTSPTDVVDMTTD